MKKFKGFIFDMDGTLVESSLDFQKIRQDIQCPPEKDVLDFVEEFDEQERARLEAIIFNHEWQDAQAAKWLGRAADFVNHLKNNAIPMAIVTRNQADATKKKLSNTQVPIELVLTRDDAKAKPAPDALLIIAEKWQIAPEELIYIGDYVHDVRAANAANMTSCLLLDGDTTPEYVDEADIVVRCLTELIEYS